MIETSSIPDLVAYLRSALAIRERCGQIYDLARADKLEHFKLREDRLGGIVTAVRSELERNYPEGDVPYHSRWRHFSVGGIDREVLLDLRLAPLSAIERARAKLELAVVSVLLDAGAGDSWSYCEPSSGVNFARSEGLAVASLDGFVAGLFGATPCTVSGEALIALTPERLADLFQVSESNPLLGLAGRCALLNKLGEVVLAQPLAFCGAPGRVGGMLEAIAAQVSSDGTVHGEALLTFILNTFASIWPGRISLSGHNLGDVWRHSKVQGAGESNHLIPLHKLSQWLTYSLLEPLQEAGVCVTHLDQLTGLAEYRNGGLFIDGGVLKLKNPDVSEQRHSPSSELIIEWRALTVVLLDQVAARLRIELGENTEGLPLAKVLQGGTWSVGRKFAAERRPNAAAPLMIESDGTVF